MQTVFDFFVGFLQKTSINEYLEFAYAVILCICLLKGDITLSKFAQSFSNLEQRYFLNAKTQKVEPDPELYDCQAFISSHEVVPINEFLNKYVGDIRDSLPKCEVVDGVADVLTDMLANCPADKIANVMQSVSDVRTRFNVPDTYTDQEVFQYLNEMYLKKGVEKNAQNEPQSEPQKLPQTGEEGAQA